MSEAYKKLYDKIVSDETFRQFLDADPKDALLSIDIEPTPEILKAIETALKAIRELQKEFGIDATLGKLWVT